MNPPFILPPADLARLIPVESDLADVTYTELESPFLQLLSIQEREQPGSGKVSERCCVPGEVVFLEGEDGCMTYVIRSGRVAVLKGELQAPKVLGYRGAGEIIGEMALLDAQPRSATVVALEEVLLLGIQAADFRRLLGGMPTLGVGIMETLTSRLRASDYDRSVGDLVEQRLLDQVSRLEVEKEHLLELQRLRQETSDLIVHDLRNPLGALFGVVEVLKMVLPPEMVQTHQELLDIAGANCARMQRLVDSMLGVARMQAGEEALVLSETNVAELIRAAVDRLAIVQRGEVSVSLDLPVDLPAVQADKDKLDRVIANLLDNALKYASSGGQVVVDAAVDAEFLQVRVADDGPGIPPEDRERIFERFAQVTAHEAGQKPRRRGFGLGLAYCRLAVAAHGGQIWVEPGEGGVGSRFVFTVKL